MPDSDSALVEQLRTCSLDDLLTICMRFGAYPEGTFQNKLAAVNVRSSMESAKTAVWTRCLAFATFALAIGTVALAVVTAIR
jgi:hypothetical protein